MEQNPELAEIVRHNLKSMGIGNVNFIKEKAENYLKVCPAFDVIYLDPSRRDSNKQKVFLLKDCQPDVEALMPALFDKTNHVLLKISPLLDLKALLQALPQAVKLFVVAVGNEVKELLLWLQVKKQKEAEIEVCILQEKNEVIYFSFLFSEEEKTQIAYTAPQDYLIEPHSAILKAGAFKSFAFRFQLKKLHPNSHLYTCSEATATNLLSQKDIFPGKIFRLKAICKYDKKEVSTHLPGLKAGIKARNFPATSEEVRKKLGIGEGEEYHIFATTLEPRQLVLLITQKITD